MSYLLDTNVISELIAPRPDPRVIDWFDEADEDELFMSVVSIAEIRRGIEMMAAGRKRERLEAWSSDDLPARFEGRTLLVDAEIAGRWAKVMTRRQAIGRVIATMDAFIAATALRHNLALVTRNTADFENLELALINPWGP
jgi:predicted nucleic acid-binding protein